MAQCSNHRSYFPTFMRSKSPLTVWQIIHPPWIIVHTVAIYCMQWFWKVSNKAHAGLWFLCFLLLARNISTTSSLPMSSHFTHCLQTNGDSYLEVLLCWLQLMNGTRSWSNKEGVRYSPITNSLAWSYPHTSWSG